MVHFLQKHVASNLGTVQFSIFFFPDQSLWYWEKEGDYTDHLVGTNHYVGDIYPTSSNTTDCTSYVIFYNETHGSSDSRSKKHNVSFPLLVLQKSIEHSILLQNYPNHNLTYDVNFAQTWTVGGGYSPVANTNGNSTCGDIEYDLYGVNFGGSLIFTFGFQIIGLMLFQIISKERQKGLLHSLRSLGLYFSSYWLSYMAIFQIIVFAASLLTLIVAAIIRPYVYMLQNLDFGVLFLLIWLGVTCTVANNMFLASFLPPSGNVTSGMIFANVLCSFITILYLSFQLNRYEVFVIDNGIGGYFTTCQLAASSFSEVFSPYDGRNGFLQVLLFWLPCFHIGRVISEIASIQQYDDVYTVVEMYKSHVVYEYSSNNFGSKLLSFTIPSVSWTYGMMVLLSLIYMILSWIISQYMEGIPILQILLPKQLLRKNAVAIYTETGSKGSIVAHNLTKLLKAGKPSILTNISFEAKQGEVLCILGNNGCGKSTLFNILSGMTPPTCGHVTILGETLSNLDMDILSQWIGICQQKDYLWNELTALEHMLLHARFKGLTTTEAEKQCEQLLEIVGLYDRRNTPAFNFSGGMKRRLSAAMSMIGDIKILILDGKCIVLSQ